VQNFVNRETFNIQIFVWFDLQHNTHVMYCYCQEILRHAMKLTSYVKRLSKNPVCKITIQLPQSQTRARSRPPRISRSGGPSSFGEPHLRQIVYYV